MVTRTGGGGRGPEAPRYPALASSPAGLGWTHPYAQTLRPVDRVTSSLYHVTVEGYESEYVRQADGSWIAASPGELRGRVVAAGGGSGPAKAGPEQPLHPARGATFRRARR